jgi:hypothetical protein
VRPFSWAREMRRQPVPATDTPPLRTVRQFEEAKARKKVSKR